MKFNSGKFFVPVLGGGAKGPKRLGSAFDPKKMFRVSMRDPFPIGTAYRQLV